MALLDDADRLLVEQNVDVAHVHAGVWIKRAAWLIEPEEVRAIAYLALCEAADKWSPLRGAPFRQYAFFKIRAAIVEEIRQKVGRAGRSTTIEHRRLYASQLVSLERMVEEHGFQHGEEDRGIDAIDAECFVDAVLASLPERERFALAMRVYEDLSLREIGELLGVSESRVSQLLAAARGRLSKGEHAGLFASA